MPYKNSCKSTGRNLWEGGVFNSARAVVARNNSSGRCKSVYA